MLKTRILLGVAILGFMAGMGVLWQSGMAVEHKAMITIPGAILYIAACLMMSITFFTLDEQGRLPRKSLAYKYLAVWYTKTETTPEGKKVETPPTLDHINLCPAFWLIVVGLVLGTFCISILAGIGWIVFDVVRNGVPDLLPVVMGYCFGGLVVLIGSIYLLSWIHDLLKKHNKRSLGKVFWVIVIGSILGLIAFGVYVGAPHVVPLYGTSYGPTIQEARVAGAIEIGKGFGMVIGGVAGLFGLLFLVFWAFPWVRKSIIGRLVSGFYHRACPVIPIEPALPAPENETT